MDFKPGDTVERRRGMGESRMGRVVSRVMEGYDTWYVTTGIGQTYCENGRDLRRISPILPALWNENPSR